MKERAGELSSTLEQQNIEARQLQQQKQILEGEVEARKLEVRFRSYGINNVILVVIMYLQCTCYPERIMKRIFIPLKNSR